MKKFFFFWEGEGSGIRRGFGRTVFLTGEYLSYLLGPNPNGVSLGMYQPVICGGAKNLKN